MSYSNKPKIQTGSKTGMHHWLMQRVTAIILTLSGIWLLFFGKALADHSMEEIVTILQRPENILPLIIFSIIGFYHGGNRRLCPQFMYKICPDFVDQNLHFYNNNMHLCGFNLFNGTLKI
jgi:hypothetical protein